MLLLTPSPAGLSDTFSVVEQYQALFQSKSFKVSLLVNFKPKPPASEETLVTVQSIVTGVLPVLTGEFVDVTSVGKVA